MASIRQCQERLDRWFDAAVEYYATHPLSNNPAFSNTEIRKAKVVSSTNSRGKLDKNAELVLGQVGEIQKVSKDGKVHFTCPAMYRLGLPLSIKISPGCIELL